MSTTATRIEVAQPIAVSIRTAAALVDLPERVIREAVHTGNLSARTIGDRLRIETADLTAWFRSTLGEPAVELDLARICTTPAATAREERLWYTCTICGAAQRATWNLNRPQVRDRRLTCAGDCTGRTAHRIAGLEPIRRQDGCPNWCTDHQTWRGTEEHRHLMVITQGWHTYLGRWDGTNLEINQLVDRPDLVRKDQAVPNINCNLCIADLEVSRRTNALLGQAIALVEGRHARGDSNA